MLFALQLTNKFAVGNEVERDKTGGIRAREAEEGAQGEAEAGAPSWHPPFCLAQCLGFEIKKKKKKKEEGWGFSTRRAVLLCQSPKNGGGNGQR